MTVTTKKSLHTRFALWIFLTTGVLLIAMLLGYARLSYTWFLGSYKQEVKNRMEVVALSLESMVGKTDYMGMIQQANSLLITNSIVGVKFLDSNKQPLIQKGDTNGLLLQHPIMNGKGQLGTIHVIFTNAPVKDMIQKQLQTGLIIICIALPLTAFLMWFIIGQQLKDILSLSEQTNQIGNIEQEAIHLPGQHRQDEIGHLAQALSERHRAILQSKDQEQLLYHAINQSYDSVVITDTKARIEYVNPAFTRITGYSQEEAIGQNPHILQSGKHPEAFYKNMWNTLSKGETWQGRISNKRKNGEEYQEEAVITPVIDQLGKTHHYVAMKRDITQEVILTKKLARAEKMQTIGMMAGGVAHDLNNILSGIVGYPELLLMQLEKDSTLRQPLQAIHDSGQRAASIVADLLTVARGAAAKKEQYDVHLLVEEYLSSPEYSKLKTLYPNVTIHKQFQAVHSYIFCSQVHIKKCFMNLITNGAEAIEDTGIINISTTNEYIESNKKTNTTNLNKGNYVVITICDNGPGIAEKDLEHIFEPFYTKKMMGKSGTGLGLAVVWNTVHDHNGKIQVESGRHGTCFTLYFPVDKTKAVSLPDETGIETHATGNNEHILAIDDEQNLRDLSSQMLQQLGYKVDTAQSGEQAIKFLKKNPVDLLLIDMLMPPGMNGRQTYEQSLKINPQQKAVIVSGFSEGSDVKATLKLGASGFLKKPYSVNQLAQIVREALITEFKSG